MPSGSRPALAVPVCSRPGYPARPDGTRRRGRCGRGRCDLPAPGASAGLTGLRGYAHEYPGARASRHGSARDRRCEGTAEAGAASVPAQASSAPRPRSRRGLRVADHARAGGGEGDGPRRRLRVRGPRALHPAAAGAPHRARGPCAPAGPRPAPVAQLGLLPGGGGPGRAGPRAPSGAQRPGPAAGGDRAGRRPSHPRARRRPRRAAPRAGRGLVRPPPAAAGRRRARLRHGSRRRAGGGPAAHRGPR